MENIKVYEYVRRCIFDYPGYEMDEYLSINDNSLNLRLKYYSERAIMADILIFEGVLDRNDDRLITEFDLERLLIDNNLYMKVVDYE